MSITTTRLGLGATLSLLWIALPTSPALAGLPETVYISTTEVCDFPTIDAALAVLAPGSEIRLASPEFVLTDSLVIANRTLRIVGGYPACGASEPTSTTTLRADFSGGPALSISSGMPATLSLDLINLNIIDADNPGGNGGGLAIIGEGLVNLRNVDVLNNSAQFGGGIYAFSVSPAALNVNLVDGSRIGAPGAGNVASSQGGGVLCQQARMRLGATEISGNTAGASGGGVRGLGCQLLSTMNGGDTRIDGNAANEGAGIFASSESVISLQSWSGQRLSISENIAQGEASPRGGGVYLSGVGTQFTAHGAWIENNRAQLTGAGLFVTAGATATLGRGVDACAIGDDQCSRLSGNQLLGAAGNLVGNGAGAFVSGATLFISHTRMEGNAAGNGAVLRANGSGQATLHNVLISANTSSARLISLEGESSLRMDLATVVDNEFTAAAIFVGSSAPTALELARSVFLVQPGRSHIQGTGTTQFACLNTGEGGALGGDEHAPGFFDPNAGLYRLSAGSSNLDRCAADGNESPVDISGLPRNVDLPGVPNNVGPLDRGAYENVEELFAGGFED